VSVAKQSGSQAEQRQLSYDAVGNITHDNRASDNQSRDKNVTLLYGASNRLQNVEQLATGKSNSHYLYNAKGQRVSKSIMQADGTEQVIHFHYNNFDQLIAETDSQGFARKEYLYAGTERVALVDYGTQESGELVLVHNDHLGTPKVMTGLNAEIVWRANTLPFGESVVSVSGRSQPLEFPGQYRDDETGYSYNYFRDYDASLGRYIQSDPIGLGGGVNTFAYVSGNPVRFEDRWGLVQWEGRVNSASIVEGVGYSYNRFTLTSQTNRLGMRAIVSVTAKGWAVGAGIPFAGSHSTFIMNDLFSFINPAGFNGTFRSATAGAGFGLGYSSGAFRLGESYYAGSGKNASYDLGAALVISGEAKVTNVTWQQEDEDGNWTNLEFESERDVPYAQCDNL
jgi:RHS repeat-associated protein